MKYRGRLELTNQRKTKAMSIDSIPENWVRCSSGLLPSKLSMLESKTRLQGLKTMCFKAPDSWVLLVPEIGMSLSVKVK